MINFRQVNNLNRDYQTYNYKTAALKPKNFATADVVSFSGNKHNELLRKYGINPAEVQVVSKTCDTNLTTKEKKEFIVKALEAHEHAKKNEKIGNFCGFFTAVNTKLSNGEWTKTTNIENASDETFCGERSGIVRAWNEALEGLKLDNLMTKSGVDKAKKGLSVECLTLGSSQSPTTPLDPCSECLSWFNEDRYFKADTKVITLAKDSETQKVSMNIRTIEELLPLRSERSSIAKEKEINEMEIEYSDRAGQVLKGNKISSKRIKDVLDRAKGAHDKNTFSDLSEKNTGAAALFNNNKVEVGKKFDWTRRWHSTPDLFAIMKGFDRYREHKENLSVKAVAYYGESDVPTIKSLGMISQDRGSKDTLIVTIQDDKIKVRTILDYMPYLYISTKLKK